MKGVAKIFAHQDITSIRELRSELRFGSPHHFRNNPCSTSSISPRIISLLAQSSQRPYSRALTQSASPQNKTTKVDRRGASKRSKSLLGLRITQSPLQKRNDGQDNEACFIKISSQAPANDTEAVLKAKNPQKPSLLEKSHDFFDNRIFCCLVISPPGRAIRDFRSIKELLEAFRDAIKAHRSLYEEGRILHRDISENNIIIIDNQDEMGFKGMLIDLDLAKELGGSPSVARHQTGTMEFMVIEVLKGISHTYRHDLESFFYVFVWLCIIHGFSLCGLHRKVIPNFLQQWSSGTFEETAIQKKGLMDKKEFEAVVIAEFPPGFKQASKVAKEVLDVLFPIHEGALFTGTFEGPTMYGPIIKAFDVAARDCEE